MVGVGVANDTEYIVITGKGIPDMKIVKKAWILSGQTCSVLDVSRVKYTIKLKAMSCDNLAFLLEMVVSIGPQCHDMDRLLRYAKFLSPHYTQPNYVTQLIEGIIERETRVLAASTAMEEILKGTNDFKEFIEKLVEKLQLELDLFGLFLYSANVHQLVRIPAQEYYSYLGQRNVASNQGKMECKDYTNHKLRNTIQVSEADLEKGGGADFLKTMATINHEIMVQEVNSEVYRKQKLADAMLYEKEKAAEAQRIAAEAQRIAAEADLFVKQKEMEGELFARQKRAEWELFAEQKKAEGELFARQKKAEGGLLAEQMEVEGSSELAHARGAYLKTLLDAFGGNNIAMRDYLMTKNGVYQDMAKIDVGAVADLKPNDSVWTNGRQTLEGSTEGSNPIMKEIAGVY